MKKAIVFGALGLTGCGLVVADLSADTPGQQVTASSTNDILGDLIEAISVDAVPIYIQEKIHPKAIIDDLKRLLAHG